MARPRVFISSTYFDLRVVRADIERFTKEVGYEPVLFERGHVPYGKTEALEESCYHEVAGCDILIAIIGGRFGTTSNDQRNSISQRELKTATELGKQIYVFVERSVLAEYNTYLQNKTVQGFKPASVNDVKVFQFIDEIYSLPVGNPITPFELSDEIVRFLREQWAGLFQRLLQESSRQKELNIIEKLTTSAATLDNLVTYLTKERQKGDSAIKDILLSSHPAFAEIKKVARIPYRVVFHNLNELNILLHQRGYAKEDDTLSDGYHRWEHNKEPLGIRVSDAIFEPEGRLKIITPDEWSDDYVEAYPVLPKEEAPAAASAPPDDDDVPF